MLTQHPNAPGPTRRLPLGALLAVLAFLGHSSTATAQGGSGSGGDSAGGLVLGIVFASVVVLAAVALGMRARRRRSATEPAPEPAWADEPQARTAPAPVVPLPPATAAARTGRDAPAGTGRARVVGYTTFSDRRHAVSPQSRLQARRFESACEARGLELHGLVGDVQSYAGADLERPGLNHALELLAGGEATCLMVAGLDRLSRSAANLGTVVDWLEELGARLVVIDIDLDTDTEEGRLATRALARVGVLERTSGKGPLVAVPEPASLPPRGRPAVSDLPLLQRRIAAMRASGMTLQAIADTLNREGVPTLRGGAEWRPSSVQAATGYKRPPRGAPTEDDARA
jgi:hypothetical protein